MVSVIARYQIYTQLVNEKNLREKYKLSLDDEYEHILNPVYPLPELDSNDTEFMFIFKNMRQPTEKEVIRCIRRGYAKYLPWEAMPIVSQLKIRRHRVVKVLEDQNHPFIEAFREMCVDYTRCSSRADSGHPSDPDVILENRASKYPKIPRIPKIPPLPAFPDYNIGNQTDQPIIPPPPLTELHFENLRRQAIETTETADDPLGMSMSKALDLSHYSALGLQSETAESPSKKMLLSIVNPVSIPTTLHHSPLFLTQPSLTPIITTQQHINVPFTTNTISTFDHYFPQPGPSNVNLTTAHDISQISSSLFTVPPVCTMSLEQSAYMMPSPLPSLPQYNLLHDAAFSHPITVQAPHSPFITNVTSALSFVSQISPAVAVPTFTLPPPPPVAVSPPSSDIALIEENVDDDDDRSEDRLIICEDEEERGALSPISSNGDFNSSPRASSPTITVDDPYKLNFEISVPPGPKEDYLSFGAHTVKPLLTVLDIANDVCVAQQEEQKLVPVADPDDPSTIILPTLTLAPLNRNLCCKGGVPRRAYNGIEVTEPQSTTTSFEGFFVKTNINRLGASKVLIAPRKEVVRRKTRVPATTKCDLSLTVPDSSVNADAVIAFKEKVFETASSTLKATCEESVNYVCEMISEPYPMGITIIYPVYGDEQASTSSSITNHKEVLVKADEECSEEVFIGAVSKQSISCKIRDIYCRSSNFSRVSETGEASTLEVKPILACLSRTVSEPKSKSIRLIKKIEKDEDHSTAEMINVSSSHCKCSLRTAIPKQKTCSCTIIMDKSGEVGHAETHTIEVPFERVRSPLIHKEQYKSMTLGLRLVKQLDDSTRYLGDFTVTTNERIEVSKHYRLARNFTVHKTIEVYGVAEEEEAEVVFESSGTSLQLIELNCKATTEETTKKKSKMRKVPENYFVEHVIQSPNVAKASFAINLKDQSESDSDWDDDQFNIENTSVEKSFSRTSANDRTEIIIRNTKYVSAIIPDPRTILKLPVLPYKANYHSRKRKQVEEVKPSTSVPRRRSGRLHGSTEEFMTSPPKKQFATELPSMCDRRKPESPPPGTKRKLPVPKISRTQPPPKRKPPAASTIQTSGGL